MARLWTKQQWLWCFRIPPLADQSHRFQRFVKRVFDQTTSSDAEAPPHHPNQVKADFDAEALEAMASDTSKWWKLAVLGVVSVCICFPEAEFWPELHGILSRLKHNQGFGAHVALGSTATEVRA